MSRIVKIVLLLNLIAITVLVFVFPHLMVSPGRLIEGHRPYEKNCFACHDSFFGASSGKCISCHKVADIGVRTTQGMLIATPRTKTAFHQQLLGQDCVACHSDHRGVAIYRIRQRFSHALLKTATRDQCVGCHKAQIPDDALHRQASDKCGQCHSTEQWKPSTFDHGKYFRFDKNHRAKCTVCHTTDDYKQYTCYGCHEHSPRKVRKEHLEEGIRDFENCVKCHRSADEDEAKRAWRSIRKGVPYEFGIPRERLDRGRKRKKRDDDD